MINDIGMFYRIYAFPLGYSIQNSIINTDIVLITLLYVYVGLRV